MESFLRTEVNCSIRRGSLSVEWFVNMALFQLAQTTPDLGPDRTILQEEAMREGMSLLMMLSLLGVLIVTLLALLMVMRAIRRNRTKAAAEPTDVSLDVWVEAGKRLDSGITEFDEDL